MGSACWAAGAMALVRLFRSQCSITHRSLFGRLTETPCLTSVALKQTVAEELGLPTPPKMPANGYLRYLNAIRPNVKRQYPSIEAKAITTKLAQYWQALPAHEKIRWNNEYQKEKEIYDRKNEEYLRKLSPKQIQDMKDLKSQRRHDKAKKLQNREIKKESESLGKPKHPGNVFM